MENYRRILCEVVLCHHEESLCIPERERIFVKRPRYVYGVRAKAHMNAILEKCAQNCYRRYQAPFFGISACALDLIFPPHRSIFRMDKD